MRVSALYQKKQPVISMEFFPPWYQAASELISFIKSHYDFTLGCAGYSEGHIEGKNVNGLYGNE